MSSKESSPNISEIRNNNFIVKEGTVKRKSSKTNFFRHTWQSVYCIVRQVQTGASIEFYTNHTVYVNKEEEPIDIFIVDPGLKAKKKDKEFGTLSQRFNVLTTENSVVALKANDALEAEEWLSAINGCFKLNRVNSFEKLEAVTDSLNEVIYNEVRSLSPPPDNEDNNSDNNDEKEPYTNNINQDNNNNDDEKKQNDHTSSSSNNDNNDNNNNNNTNKSKDNFHNRVMAKLGKKQPETSRKVGRRGPRHYSQFRPQTSRVGVTPRINARNSSPQKKSERKKSSLKSTSSPKRRVRKALPRYHSLPSNISKHLTNEKHKHMNMRRGKTMLSARTSTGNTMQSRKSRSPPTHSGRMRRVNSNNSIKSDSSSSSSSSSTTTTPTSPSKKKSKSREQLSMKSPPKTLLSGHLPRRQMSPTNQSSRKKLIRRRIARSASMDSNIEKSLNMSREVEETTTDSNEGEGSNKKSMDDNVGETRIGTEEGVISKDNDVNSKKNSSQNKKKKSVSSPTNRNKNRNKIASSPTNRNNKNKIVRKNKVSSPTNKNKSINVTSVKKSRSLSPTNNNKSKSLHNEEASELKNNSSKDNSNNNSNNNNNDDDDDANNLVIPGLSMEAAQQHQVVNSANDDNEQNSSKNNDKNNNNSNRHFEDEKRPILDPLTPRRVNYLRKIAQWKKEKQPEEENNDTESEDSLSFGDPDNNNKPKKGDKKSNNKVANRHHRAVSMGDIRSKVIKSDSSTSNNSNNDNNTSKSKNKLSSADRRKSQERILRSNDLLDERRQVQSAFREKLLSMKRISICLNTKMSSFLRYKRNLNRFMYCLPIEEDDKSAPLEATFHVVKGFVDGDTTCVAFECVDKSGHGHFLKHTGPQKGLKMEDVTRFLKQRGKSWTKDYSWRVTPAIDLAERLGLCDTPESKTLIEEKYGQSDMIALESVNKGNHFCRHKNTEIVLAKAELTLNFLEDSTFRIVQPLHRGKKR